MKPLLLRLLIGVLGLLAGLLALFIPLSFIANEVQEGQSARQYNGHLSLWGALGGSLLVIAITVAFGVAAYRLLRRATRPQ